MSSEMELEARGPIFLLRAFGIAIVAGVIFIGSCSIIQTVAPGQPAQQTCGDCLRDCKYDLYDKRREVCDEHCRATACTADAATDGGEP